MTALSAEAVRALRVMRQTPHNRADTPRPVLIVIARKWLAYRRMIGPHKKPSPSAPRAQTKKTLSKKPEWRDLLETQDFLELIAEGLSIKQLDSLKYTNRTLYSAQESEVIFEALRQKRIEIMRTFYKGISSKGGTSIGEGVIKGDEPKRELYFLEDFYLAASKDVLTMVDYEEVRSNFKLHMRNGNEASELERSIQMGMLREPVFSGSRGSDVPEYYLLTLFDLQEGVEQGIRILIQKSSQSKICSSDIFIVDGVQTANELIEYDTFLEVFARPADPEEEGGVDRIFAFQAHITTWLFNYNEVFFYSTPYGLSEERFGPYFQSGLSAIELHLDPDDTENIDSVTIRKGTSDTFTSERVSMTRYDDLMPTFKIWHQTI